jgi:hypothetical protein
VRFPQAGLYPFRLDWYDTIGGALLDWYHAPGDRSAEPFTGSLYALVDTADLYPTGSLPCAADCAPCPARAPRCDLARSRCVQCTRDPECLSCERCVDGACIPLRGLPDAAVPAPCLAPPDAAAPQDARDAWDAQEPSTLPPRDAPGQDATEDTMTPTPAAPGGCGCRVAARERASGLAVVALLGGRRRRRRR